MNNSPAIEAIISAVRGYLQESPARRGLLDSPEPLDRCVEIRSTVWRPWLADGGHAHSRQSYRGLVSADRSKAAIDLLDSLPEPSKPATRRDRYVKRTTLVGLSAAARKESSTHNLVQLWVATMMWGSGTSYGRGPWRTTQGLAEKGLPEVLRDSLANVVGGDLDSAYRGSHVPGCGESFFTKWLWSASLADKTASPRPLILDYRVRSTLAKLLKPVDGWTAPRGPQGYVGYVGMMDAAAAALRPEFAGIDSENLEWLMFDRQPEVSGKKERCLFDWLPAGT